MLRKATQFLLVWLSIATSTTTSTVQYQPIQGFIETDRHM
jgi:hypothetical protein